MVAFLEDNPEFSAIFKLIVATPWEFTDNFCPLIQPTGMLNTTSSKLLEPVPIIFNVDAVQLTS